MDPPARKRAKLRSVAEDLKRPGRHLDAKEKAALVMGNNIFFRVKTARTNAGLYHILTTEFGVAEATVTRVLHEVDQTDGHLSDPRPGGRRGFMLNESDVEKIRRVVREGLTAGVPVSAKAIMDKLKFACSERTLRRTMKRYGSRFGQTPEAAPWKENPAIVKYRKEYVKKMPENRGEGDALTLRQPLVVLDESYCNLHHTAR